MLSRERVTEALAERKAALEGEALERRLATEGLDMTLPAAPAPQGSVHPVSQVMDELAEIFADMGFSVATGPEIEDDWHNFTALNFPPDHPARAMHDTFYFETVIPAEAGTPARKVSAGSPDPGFAGMTGGGCCSHPHFAGADPGDDDAASRRSTSSHRAGPTAPTTIPPTRRCSIRWRGWSSTADIHLGHLKWTLETFLKAFFERDDIVLRLRPSYFPFTEPSAEVDVGYTRVKGRRVLGGSEGWMELLGSGMVHPRVIANCGLDPDEWQGFAFGAGIDRLAMLKYGMDDLRAFFDGDLRWLRHYGFAALDVPTLSGGVGA